MSQFVRQCVLHGRALNPVAVCCRVVWCSAEGRRALNLINAARKYKRIREELVKVRAWPCPP